MKADWFSRLYEKELKIFGSKLRDFEISISDEKSELDIKRKRDYTIYKACLHTAYTNDEANNQECKITTDEQSILDTLANQLELSQEEIKLIHYLIVPIVRQKIDDVVSELKSAGLLFFSRKLNTVFIADEVVRILRKVRGSA